MSSPHRDLGRIIDKLRAATDHPRPDMGQFADLRDGGNLPRHRPWWYIPAAVLGGMLLFAAIVHADPIGRTVDAVVNPHLEGWE